MAAGMKRKRKREQEHAPALEREIAEYRALGADEVAGWFEALLANTPDARKVRDWFKKHVRPGTGELHRELSPLISIEDWEVEILDLVFYQFKRFVPVSKRELIPQDKLGNL